MKKITTRDRKLDHQRNKHNRNIVRHFFRAIYGVAWKALLLLALSIAGVIYWSNPTDRDYYNKLILGTWVEYTKQQIGVDSVQQITDYDLTEDPQ